MREPPWSNDWLLSVSMLWPWCKCFNKEVIRSWPWDHVREFVVNNPVIKSTDAGESGIRGPIWSLRYIVTCTRIRNLADVFEWNWYRRSDQNRMNAHAVHCKFHVLPNFNWIHTMFMTIKIWNELRPLLCTYRLNCIRRTSWGWWDEWDDTALQTQDSKFKPWKSDTEHATSPSRRLPTILSFMSGWGRIFFFFF